MTELFLWSWAIVVSAFLSSLGLMAAFQRKGSRKILSKKAEQQELTDWMESAQWLKKEDREELKSWGFDISCIPRHPEESKAIAETAEQPAETDGQSTEVMHADGFPWTPPRGWFPKKNKPEPTLILSKGVHGGTAVAKNKDGNVVAVSTDLVSAKIPSSQLPSLVEEFKLLREEVADLRKRELSAVRKERDQSKAAYVDAVELKNVREATEIVHNMIEVLSDYHNSGTRIPMRVMKAIGKLHDECIEMNRKYQRTPGIKVTARDKAQELADLADEMYDDAHEYMTEVHGYDDFRLMG